MDRHEEPPPIVVKAAGKSAPAQWKKRRHPAKTGMLIALVLWPVLFVTISGGLGAIAISGARRMANGQYVIDGQFGLQLTTAGELVFGSVCFGAFCSTALFAVAMIVLGIAWFATKD